MRGGGDSGAVPHRALRKGLHAKHERGGAWGVLLLLRSLGRTDQVIATGEGGGVSKTQGWRGREGGHRAT